MSDLPGPVEAAPEKRNLLSGATGWVGGLTALVIAFTGLLKACDEFLPAEEAKAPAEVAAAADTGGTDAAAPDAAGEAEAPALYEGDGIKLEWTEDKWTLTDQQGTYDYEEMVDPVGQHLMAFNKAEDSYLRWPEPGGQLEESLDDKASWAAVGTVEPAAASAE